jgi:glutamine---fructose-6-phosphate transaminase (isomerizing)
VPAVAVGATTAEHPGAALVLRTVEPETSTTYTTSHLAAMTAMAMVATVAAERAGRGNAATFRPYLERLPELVKSILARGEEVAAAAERAVGRRIYAIGAGPNEWTAQEVMIKVREAAYHPIDGMAAEQFLLGPMVAANAGDLAIAIHVPGRGAERVAEITRSLDAIGVGLWIVGTPVPGLDAPAFALPDMPELLTPLLALVPLQLFASRLADLNGANPDEFRCDEPVHRSAFAMLAF